MKPSSVISLLVGVLTASSAAIVPLWLKRMPPAPESRKLVFVLPHEFRGPYQADDEVSLWMHRQDWGSLLREDLSAARADAMWRQYRLTFRPVGVTRDQALQRLAAVQTAWPGWNLSFRAASAETIAMTMTDPPADTADVLQAVRSATGADVDLARAQVEERPRMGARYLLAIRKDAQLPDDSIHPRQMTPALEVRNYVRDLLLQGLLPATTILEIEAPEEERVRIRARGTSLADLQPLFSRCPGVFDQSSLQRESDSWFVRVIRGATLPNGRVLRLYGVTPAEAVRNYYRKTVGMGILSIEVNGARVAVQTDRPGGEFLDALELATPRVFDLRASEVEQILTIRVPRPGGDPALMVDVATTLDALRRISSKYDSLAHGTEVEFWKVIRVLPAARFSDGRSMTPAEAKSYVELLLRLQMAVDPVVGIHPRLAQRGGVPMNAAALDRALAAIGDASAIAIDLRVVDGNHIAYMERWADPRFPEILDRVCPGYFSAVRGEIVLKSRRLDYGVLEACSVPLAGSPTRLSGFRWIHARRFWVHHSDDFGDVEAAIRDGRVSAGFVAEPAHDIPSTDLGLRAVLAGIFNCSRVPSARTRGALVRAMQGERIRLQDVDLRILCRRHRRVSREQALLVAERLRACGASASVEPETDVMFQKRLSAGEFDLVVDAFPVTLWTRPERWWATGSANPARLRDAELRERLDRARTTWQPDRRAQTEAWARQRLEEASVWTVFRWVPVRLCGTQEGLRMLGYRPVPQD